MNSTHYREWRSELRLTITANTIRHCDFNRLLYLGIPATELLQKPHSFQLAGRDKLILKLRKEYDTALENGVSETTLYHLFNALKHYLNWCDAQQIDAFTQAALKKHFLELLEHIMLGKIKNTTYTRKKSNLFVIFRDYLDFPANWFLVIPNAGKDQLEPYEAYTRSDLNKLLPFLRKLFNQTSEQFLLNPQKHLKAHHAVPTMIFEWRGEKHQLCAGVSKMMCAATFLMSYYTYSNTNTLLQLQRPTGASTPFGEQWYSMPAFKRRSFKIVHVEMGGHDHLEVPKYSLSFFDKLLEVSKAIDDSEGAPLLQTVAFQGLRPITNTTLDSFNTLWLQVHFNFVDQKGKKLRPIVSRFRETGALTTRAFQGELANDITLDNTQQTRRRHYSTGNKYNNNAMMQDVASIRQQQAKHKQDSKTAQKNLGIEVLAIEQEQRINFPNLSKNPNGGSCANPFGTASESFNRKVIKHGLSKDGEKLACADLLKCFGCPEQVIVQSVDDIWCLLSFKACIEESLYLHLDNNHFRSNFENVIDFISKNILPKINKNILKKAESRLDTDGPHPLWEDSESILGMLPADFNSSYGMV
jgi:hypothetical protein